MPSLPQRETRWIAVVIVFALFVGLRFAAGPTRRTTSLPRAAATYPADTLRAGVIDGEQYRNEFFKFTAPIPPGWAPLSDDELKIVDAAWLNVLRKRQAALGEETTRRVHSHHIFGLRRIHGRSLEQSPGLVMLAEPAPTTDVKASLERMAREVEQAQNLSARASAPYTMNAKQGVLEVIDLDVSGNGVTGYLSLHGVARSGYMIAIMVIANDAPALAELKQIVAAMEF